MTQAVIDQLADKHCSACHAEAPVITPKEAEIYLKKLPDWTLSTEGTTITRRFVFKGYLKTMSFVNAIAWMTQNEGHHPDMMVTYNSCEVNYTTHALEGLSENDFICAAKVDQLFAATQKG